MSARSIKSSRTECPMPMQRLTFNENIAHVVSGGGESANLNSHRTDHVSFDRTGRS